MREPRGAVKPADDELLRARALELEPVARARGDVRRAEALGDQPLPAVAARVRRAAPRRRRSSARSCAAGPPAQHALEHLPPLLERERAHVAPVRDQHVERVVEELAALAAAEPVAAADERRPPRRRSRSRRPGPRRAPRPATRSGRSAPARCASTAAWDRPP